MVIESNKSRRRRESI